MTTDMVKPANRANRPGGAVNDPHQAQPWDFGAWTNPAIGGPVVWVTGVVLHMFDIDWYWPLLAGLGFTTSFYAAARSRRLRRLGVVYTVASSLVATGWLTYATQVLTFDVFDLAGSTLRHVIAGVVTAIPMLVVYALLIRDAGQARVGAYLASHDAATSGDEPHVWEQITKAAGIKKWIVATEPIVSADAITVTMRIQPGGTTYRQAIAQIDALELACNAPFPGAIRLEQPRGQGVATVVIRQALRSTLEEIVPAPPVPDQPRSILEPLVDSRFDDGEMSGRVHAYQTVITLGQRDSGKTGLQNMRVDAYAQMSDVFMLYVDFKEGRFLRPWLTPVALGQVDTPVFGGIGTTVHTVDMMLNGLLAIGASRAASTTGDKITPTPSLPAIRLGIDEIADLLSNQNYQHIAAKLIHVVRKLRSEGIDIDIASQRGTMSFLGAAARDLLSQATIVDLLRVDSAAEVYNALSIPADRLGSVDPTRFEYPGTKLTLARGSRLAAARTMLISSDAIPARAAHYAPWRPGLEASAIAAADKATGGAWSRMMAYQTDEARAVLAASAAAAGDQAAADRWSNGHQPTINTTVDTPEQAPVSTPATDATETRTRFIEEHGAEAWEKAQGRMALIAMRTIIGDQEHMLTKDLIDRLASADAPRWGYLTPRALATLVSHHGVDPVPIRAENNARGYTRAAVEAAFDM